MSNGLRFFIAPGGLFGVFTLMVVRRPPGPGRFSGGRQAGGSLLGAKSPPGPVLPGSYASSVLGPRENKKGPAAGERSPQGRALFDTRTDAQALPVPVASFTTTILAVRASISTPKSGHPPGGGCPYAPGGTSGAGMVGRSNPPNTIDVDSVSASARRGPAHFELTTNRGRQQPIRGGYRPRVTRSCLPSWITVRSR